MEVIRWPEVKEELQEQIIVLQAGESKIEKLTKSLFLMSNMRNMSKSSMELYKEGKSLKTTVDFW